MDNHTRARKELQKIRTGEEKEATEEKKEYRTGGRRDNRNKTKREVGKLENIARVKEKQRGKR